MTLLKDKDRDYLIKEFEGLTNPVKLMLFTNPDECEYCEDTQTIAEEVASLSDKVSLEVCNIEANQDVAARYGIQAFPAIVMLQDGPQPKDFGIRYFGIPAGYEFSSLVHDIVMVGKGETQLTEATKQWLAELKVPVHLQVFVTPTCPYCPQAVLLAHQMAMQSEMIRADMVEATEFPDLAMKYDVMGVPRTVINEDTFVEGAVPEAALLSKMKQALAI